MQTNKYNGSCMKYYLEMKRICPDKVHGWYNSNHIVVAIKTSNRWTWMDENNIFTKGICPIPIGYLPMEAFGKEYFISSFKEFLTKDDIEFIKSVDYL